MKDYYYILGVDRTDSIDNIKKAYRKLSIKFHPDKNPDDKFFERRFKDIQEAYEVLTNKREEYNIKYDAYFSYKKEESTKTPIIKQFEVDKNKIYEGDSINLKWDVVDADYIKLSILDGKQNPSGNLVYTPSSGSGNLVITIYAINNNEELIKSIPITIIESAKKYKQNNKSGGQNNSKERTGYWGVEWLGLLGIVLFYMLLFAICQSEDRIINDQNIEYNDNLGKSISKYKSLEDIYSEVSDNYISYPIFLDSLRDPKIRSKIISEITNNKDSQSILLNRTNSLLRMEREKPSINKKNNVKKEIKNKINLLYSDKVGVEKHIPRLITPIIDGLELSQEFNGEIVKETENRANEQETWISLTIGEEGDILYDKPYYEITIQVYKWKEDEKYFLIHNTFQGVYTKGVSVYKTMDNELNLIVENLDVGDLGWPWQSYSIEEIDEYIYIERYAGRMLQGNDLSNTCWISLNNKLLFAHENVFANNSYSNIFIVENSYRYDVITSIEPVITPNNSMKLKVFDKEKRILDSIMIKL